ncbi:aspartate/glutamate racemase family protein [Gemmatimonadota bacterium]
MMQPRTIGLIGGMSWISTAAYYQTLNELAQHRLGDSHSARIVLWSVNFAEHLAIHHNGGWKGVADEIINIGHRLRYAGADILALCVNTIHHVAAEIEDAVGLPLIHIADAVGQAILEAGISRVGLIGTKYTMGEEWYRSHLNRYYGLEVLLPEGDDFETIDTIIYQELVSATFTPSSRDTCYQIITRLFDRGAEGVILGCTELPLLLAGESWGLTLFDSLQLHAEEIFTEALSPG